MTNELPRIVLASSSPYRKELLNRLQFEFDIAVPDIDESRNPDETPSQLVRRLSIEKANAIAEKLLNAIVIGSDQVAAFDNQILGKPGNYETAVEQLKMISGKRIVFHTGLTIIHTDSAKILTDEIKTLVEFKELDERMIRNYLKKEPAFNCAGSFKSEGLGIALTKRIVEDDPTALIGLPLIRLTQMLESVGYPVL